VDFLRTNVNNSIATEVALRGRLDRCARQIGRMVISALVFELAVSPCC
jgi:hypothetical protein